MSEPDQSDPSIDLIEENERLKATIEELESRLQGQRRVSQADTGKLELLRAENGELRRESVQLKAELHSLDPGGVELDKGLFIYRTSPSSFARPLIVPPVVHQAVEAESGKWDSGSSSNTASWIDRLRRSELPLAYERCLHNIFVTKVPTCWTRMDPRCFACRVCTNIRRPCCIWDVGRKKVIVLPIVPELHGSGRQGEPTHKDF